jgi:hypothetical protein
MSNIVPASAQPTAIIPTDLAGAMTLGEVFYKSGMFPDVKSEAQAVVKVLAGQELGLPPFASIQGIEIVEGKPTLKPVLLAGLIRRRGAYDYAVLETTEERAEIAFYRVAPDGGRTYLGSSSYDMARAQKANLAGKHNWRTRPQEMLYWRAMSNGVRMYCPDVVLGGAYVEGEVDDAPSQQPTTPIPTVPPPALPPTPSTPTAVDPMSIGTVTPSVDVPDHDPVDADNNVTKAYVDQAAKPLDIDPPVAQPQPAQPQRNGGSVPPDPQPPAATPERDQSARPVSVQQLRNMLQLAEANGLTAETLAAWVKSKGFAKSSSITRAAYPALIAEIESGDAFAQLQKIESARRAQEILARDAAASPSTTTTGDDGRLGL